MKALSSAPRLSILALLFVLLAAIPASAQHSFDWEITWQGAVKDLLILEDFHTLLTNTGAAADSFEVSLVKVMPAFWQATICEGPVCYPPSVTVHKFNLEAGASTNLDFAITAALEEGQGSSIVTVRSLGNPAVTETNSFTVLTSGLDVLTVAADGGAGYAPYYTEAITSAGRTTGIWNRSVMGALTSVELGSFDAVVWFTGTSGDGLTDADRANLQEYVGNGGNLFLTGQNLARDYCWPGSPGYSPGSHAWFTDILGIDFQADSAGSPLVSGVPGDPVGDGLILAINGGDGADNNTSPDEITVLGDALVSLSYDTGPAAAARSTYLDGRTFFAAFGFEGVATANQRQDLMTAVLGWITNRFSAVDDDLQRVTVSPAVVTPNPFNPQTSIKFEVGGDRPVPGDVVIFDLRGRVVRHLFAGTVDPGPRTMVWNGRDNLGRSLSSGIYLARVTVAANSQTVKMTLAR